jgi:hypothetical protein
MEIIQKRLLHDIELVDETFCWLWKGSKMGRGYGQITVEGKCQGAHRLAYKIFRNAADIAGKETHHLCGNKSCCNPWHLKALTRTEHLKEHGRSPPTPETLRARCREYARRYRLTHHETWLAGRRRQKARYRARQLEKKLLAGEVVAVPLERKGVRVKLRIGRPKKPGVKVKLRLGRTLLSPEQRRERRAQYKRRCRELYPDKWREARKAQKARYAQRYPEKIRAKKRRQRARQRSKKAFR